MDADWVFSLMGYSFFITWLSQWKKFKESNNKNGLFSFLSVLLASILIHILNILRRPCGNCNCLTTLKLYQNSLSVGAVAGFAIAIVFTWKLLRSPTVHQRRPRKRQAPTSSSSGISSHSNAVLLPSGIASSSEDTRAQNVVDEFFQPVKVRVEWSIFYLD